MTSEYVLRPLRGLCQTCRERIAREDTGQCVVCCPNVLDFEAERKLREYERMMEGRS